MKNLVQSWMSAFEQIRYWFRMSYTDLQYSTVSIRTNNYVGHSEVRQTNVF